MLSQQTNSHPLTYISGFWPNGWGRRLAWFFLLLSVAGCSTLYDAKNAEGSGKRQIYTSNIDEVWKVAELSLQDLGLDVIEKNRQSGYMLAKRNMTAGSYGENVALFIRGTGPAKTAVEVVSKKVLATTIFAPDWTDRIFSRLDARLKK